MQLAVMTEPQLGGTYQELAALASWAEQTGLVGFARSDHLLARRTPAPEATEAFTTLAALARDTTSIRLGVLVSPITFRHPAVVAKMAATIDQISDGRFDLGVGTGWMELEHDAFGLPFPPWDERFARLEEALDYLAACFGEDPGSLSGRYYELDASVRPRPSGLRMVIGGSGPSRTPELAGRYADEYNLFLAPVAETAARIEAMRAAAVAAGRDPQQVVVSLLCQVITGRDGADYGRRLAEEAARHEVDPTELERRWGRNGILAGEPERVAATLAELEEVGVSKLYVQQFDLKERRHLEAAIAAAGG